jgi:hypothetical protein
MTLQKDKLQIVDTNDVLLIDLTTGVTMFSGFTTSASLDQKVTAIPISGGIGDQLKANLSSKKTITSKISISQFELDFLCSMSGVALDTISTGSYYLAQSVPVATLAATVIAATRILAVQTLDGTFLNIVDVAPTDATEVEVSGTTLTFFAGFTDTAILVSYEAPAATGKDNYTVSFNASAFPKNAEMIYHTRAFDTDTENVVADVYTHFYKVAIDPTFSFTFTASKQTPTAVSVNILVPDYLPDGTQNLNNDIGDMVITER